MTRLELLATQIKFERTFFFQMQKNKFWKISLLLLVFIAIVFCLVDGADQYQIVEAKGCELVAGVSLNEADVALDWTELSSLLISKPEIRRGEKKNVYF